MRTQISDVVKTGGLLFLLLFMPLSSHAAQQIVGKISFARGSAAAQQPNGTPRILGKDAEIFQGDNIQTAERSFVIIEFTDGTKVTVRPNSSFSIDQYDAQAKNPKAELSLHEGGIRASSGEIAKQSPENFQIKTSLATVKAQQADYSVRLCKQDCGQEMPGAQVPEAQADAVPVKTDQSVVARVADIKGLVLAKNQVDKNAKERQLSLGAPLYSEDYLHSQKDSFVLMVFRDGEKITLQADSEMDIAQYHYQQDGVKDHALYRLTTGGMRALTGSIGKTDKTAYAVQTPVGTIGIRGTGFDLSCVGDCVNETGDASMQSQNELSEGLYTDVWQGQIALTNETGEHLLTMPDSHYIASPRSDAFLFPNLPDTLFNNIAPRPDRNSINIQKLFAAQALKGAPSGLYVAVHKGHVQLANNAAKGGEKATTDLGKDEVAHVGPQKNVTRLSLQPQFQRQDAYPLPDQSNGQQKNTGVYSLLNDDDKGGGGGCQTSD
ncbi:MAG: FecR domain-containing protein [Methylovulum sp.]|nr:FecR domain-containing protein [Methylovulum sp.]